MFVPGDAFHVRRIGELFIAGFPPGILMVVGFVVVMVVEPGMIAPPIGMNVFVIKGMTPNVRLAAIHVGVIPLVLAQLVLIIAVLLIPDIAPWLPETAKAFR